MKKKVLTYISIIALISALCLSLVACNSDLYAKNIVETLEDNGYVAEILKSGSEEFELIEEMIEETDDYSGRIRWIVSGIKMNEDSSIDSLIQVYKFALASDAKQFENDSKDGNLTENWTVVRKGNVVMLGNQEVVDLFA